MKMPFYDWAGVPQMGDIVLRTSAADDMQRVFYRAFKAKFPIRKMRLADVYKGDDVTSMAADNTSAFNCRKVTGNPYRLSQHSYGHAIDINTVENPYVTSSRVYPAGSQTYLNRRWVRKGMIVSSGPIAAACERRAGPGELAGPTPTTSTSPPTEVDPRGSGPHLARSCSDGSDARASEPRLHDRGLGGVVVALTTVLVLAGCGQSEPDNQARPAPSATSESATAPVVPETPPPAVKPTTKAGATDAAGLVIPGKTAGKARRAQRAQARRPRRGWEQFVDPGDVAEGYAGNGAWVRERGAAEVVQAVVPLGCVGMTSPPVLPVPKHALEGTYRGPGDAPGVALVLDFASTAKASAFVGGMATIARACYAPSKKVGNDDPLTVVVEPVRLGARTVLDRRREYGVGATPWLWSEMVVQHGARVGLLILATAPSADQPNLDRLSEVLRTAVSR